MNIRILFITVAILIILSIGDCEVMGDSMSHQSPEQTPCVDVIAQTLQQLRSIQVAPYDSDIPLPVKPLFAQLKRQLCDFILKTINTPWETPQHIQQQIISTLQHTGIAIEEAPYEQEQDYYTYDKITQIQIEQPADHPDLLVAMVTFWVMCGRDTSFYLFQKEKTEWRLVAVDETNNYDDIGDAHGMFQYAISPLDEQGQFFVITANLNCWCSSNWHGLRYQVFRVGKNPYRPIVLLQQEEYSYGWSPSTFYLQPDRFWLLFWGSAGEYERHTGMSSTIDMQMALYTVSGNHVTGFHFIPKDFLGKWLQLPWEEASTWVAPLSLSSSEYWYTRLRELGEERYTFPVIEQCGQDQDNWQIGLDLNLDADFIPDEQVFFTLTRRDNWYMLHGFYNTRPVACPATYPPDK